MLVKQARLATRLGSNCTRLSYDDFEGIREFDRRLTTALKQLLLPAKFPKAPIFAKAKLKRNWFSLRTDPRANGGTRRSGRNNPSYRPAARPVLEEAEVGVETEISGSAEPPFVGMSVTKQHPKLIERLGHGSSSGSVAGSLQESGSAANGVRPNR